MVNLSNSILLIGIKNKNTVIHFNIFYVLCKNRVKNISFKRAVKLEMIVIARVNFFTTINFNNLM